MRMGAVGAGVMGTWKVFTALSASSQSSHDCCQNQTRSYSYQTRCVFSDMEDISGGVKFIPTDAALAAAEVPLGHK